VQEKIVKYSQFHANEAVRSAYGSAMPLASYDGAAEMWAASMEDLLEVSLFSILTFSFAFERL
jgi:hypothetical protein